MSIWLTDFAVHYGMGGNKPNSVEIVFVYIHKRFVWDLASAMVFTSSDPLLCHFDSYSFHKHMYIYLFEFSLSTAFYILLFASLSVLSIWIYIWPTSPWIPFVEIHQGTNFRVFEGLPNFALGSETTISLVAVFCIISIWSPFEGQNNLIFQKSLFLDPMQRYKSNLKDAIPTLTKKLYIQHLTLNCSKTKKITIIAISLLYQLSRSQ